MLTCELDTVPEFIRAASFPGGTARQYRVQVYHDDGGYWQMYANFPHKQQADACWRKLTLEGHQARIIDATRSPSAA